MCGRVRAGALTIFSWATSANEVWLAEPLRCTRSACWPRTLEEAAPPSAYDELIADSLPGRKYVVGLASNPNFKGGNVELFVARLEDGADGRRLPPATQRRPPPPAFGSRGRRLGRRFAMYTGGLVEGDAFADFDDY